MNVHSMYDDKQGSFRSDGPGLPVFHKSLFWFATSIVWKIPPLGMHIHPIRNYEPCGPVFLYICS